MENQIVRILMIWGNIVYCVENMILKMSLGKNPNVFVLVAAPAGDVSRVLVG